MPDSSKTADKAKDPMSYGPGTLNYADGSKYIGEYTDSKPNGRGTYTYSDGSRYVGEYKNGKRNGRGTLSFADGHKYVGEYKDGERNGQGMYTFADGRKHIGEYKDSKPNGQGTYTYPDGSKYVGEYKNGKRDGQGTFTLADGSKYIGEFKDGLRDGQGMYTIADGRKHVGGFKDDKRNGQGTFISSDGSKFVGEFKEGKRNGQGIKYDRNGSVVQDGKWANNDFVRHTPVRLDDKPSHPELARPAKTEEVKAQVALRPAQTNRPSLITQAERRVALVIGNAAYKENPLPNPVNDSNDITESLQSLGFDVIKVNNATLTQMREATRHFADKLAASDVGLVFYAGHGLELNGRNYLIPINAQIAREYEVRDRAFDASQFTEMMDSIIRRDTKYKARVNILILDSCRDGGPERSWRGRSTVGNGFAPMSAPRGTFIAYSTAPRTTAADGEGRNSPYTKHLLQALRQPNVPIERLFKFVRAKVIEETKARQIPWENSSLVGEFFFRRQQ